MQRLRLDSRQNERWGWEFKSLYDHLHWDCSSASLECYPDKVKVVGATPISPTPISPTVLLLFDNLGDISAEVAQLVVHDFAEVDVASSSLVFRLLPDGVI